MWKRRRYRKNGSVCGLQLAWSLWYLESWISECGRMPKGYGYFYLSSWAFIWRKSLDLDCSWKCGSIKRVIMQSWSHIIRFITVSRVHSVMCTWSVLYRYWYCSYLEKIWSQRRSRKSRKDCSRMILYVWQRKRMRHSGNSCRKNMTWNSRSIRWYAWRMWIIRKSWMMPEQWSCRRDSI